MKIVEFLSFHGPLLCCIFSESNFIFQIPDLKQLFLFSIVYLGKNLVIFSLYLDKTNSYGFGLWSEIKLCFSTLNGQYRVYYKVITYYCLCHVMRHHQIAYNVIVLKSPLMPVPGSCQRVN